MPAANASSRNLTASNDLVVYLDTSGSMAGYLSRDGQTIFGKTLRELRFATGTFSAGNDLRVVVRHVGSDIGAPLSDMNLTTASQDPSVFRAGETNLAGAISSFRNGPRSQEELRDTAQGDSSRDRSDSQNRSVPARFNILVTDGVQSTRRGSSVQDCTAGSDQFCVRQKIGELLQQGWGGCVIGIRADFHGRVYSEVNGSAIPYESNNDSSSFRPFYLYVFSPDPAALDPLVNTIKERLRQFVPGTDSIRELNLSFPYTTGFGTFQVSVPKDSKEWISENIDRGGPPQRINVHVDVNTENAGAKPFQISVKIPWSRHALDTASTNELAKLLDWKLVAVNPAAPVKDERFVDLTVVSTEGADEITLQAKAGFPRGPESPSCRIYRLEGRINLNQATPPWIRAWSTDLDNTREAGNRTFNLETALLGLWNNSTVKDQIVAQAYLRVGPPD